MRVRRVVDLSAPLDEATVTYPGDPALRFAVHSTIAQDGFNLLSVQMGSQSGTHVDAPYHFEQHAARIDEVPLERFIGRGVVVDASALGAREPITWEQIGPVADRLGPDAVTGVMGENLRHLDAVTWRPWVMVFPLAFRGADGAPVRAVAVEFGD